MRNAIHALQEMRTPSLEGGSTHSNPNITRVPHSCSGNGMIARSTSHPPEMFCWNEPATPHHVVSCVDREIQTDFDAIHDFIVENPSRVLEILGLDPEIVKKRNRILNESDEAGKRNDWKNCPFFWETTDLSGPRTGSKLYETINQNADSKVIAIGKSNDEDA